MRDIPQQLMDYHSSGKSLVCELDANPYCCEFWKLDELESFNAEYEVPKYAPGFLGFATSGGGEMFAISPAGEIVCLPFIGMAPTAAVKIASSWHEFEGLLKAI
jgi:hypothetical protein